MKVELKNVKIARFASEETTCFTASLYIDGKKAATVENQGRGGCNFYHFDDRSLETRFRDYCKSLPPLSTEFGILDMDADLFVGELLNLHEKRKMCKRETLFRIQGDPSGQYRSIRSPFTAAVKDHITKEYGPQVEEILNETVA